MSSAAAGAEVDSSTPTTKGLCEAVRRGLSLSDSVPVALVQVEDYSNINYVYRAEAGDRSLYLKVVPERPKRLAAQLPRERIFSEAEALRRCRALVGDALLIPEVLFVDREHTAFGMSDVGQGRSVLLGQLPQRLDLLAEQAQTLGGALGRFHGGTRGGGPLRPPTEEAIIRSVIFDGLIAPGAVQVFPEQWPEIGQEMQSHRQCLVHADLWAKNLLAAPGRRLAVVDFEGAHYGDPAFDLGTVLAVSMLPAMERPELWSLALNTVDRLVASWNQTCGDAAWAAAVWLRAFRATATFLAARSHGPFAYAMEGRCRGQVADLALSLASDPPATLDAFRERVVNP